MQIWRVFHTTLVLVCGGAALATPGYSQMVFNKGVYAGQIVGQRGPEILVKTNTGAMVIANMDPNGKINGGRPRDTGKLHVEVTGEIRGEHLAKENFVRFRAKFKGSATRRKALDPITQLELFTPDGTTKFGLLAEGLGGDAAEKAAPDEVREFLVVGAITSKRGNTIGVEFGGAVKGSVTATVPDDAVVNVKINRLYAPPGAQITVEGWQVEVRQDAQPQNVPRGPVHLLATSVHVQLPPPAPPKSKLAQGPAAKKGDQPGEADPFAAGAGGPDPPDAKKPEQVLIPGEIIKLN